MSKDPAFLFYSNNFLSGTMLMSNEQVGKYIRLLIAQHQNGHLSENHMNFICNGYDPDIFSKFIKDENGLYYNERLETEINKRVIYCNSRGKNKKGHKKNETSENDMNDISKSYENHTSIFNIQSLNNNSLKEKEGTGEKENFGSIVIMDFETLKLRLSQQTFIEQILMSSYANGIDEKKLRSLILEFCETIRDQGLINKSFAEHKKHFISWLKIQIKSAKNGKPNFDDKAKRFIDRLAQQDQESQSNNEGIAIPAEKVR